MPVSSICNDSTITSHVMTNGTTRWHRQEHVGEMMHKPTCKFFNKCEFSSLQWNHTRQNIPHTIDSTEKKTLLGVSDLFGSQNNSQIQILRCDFST